MEKEEDIKDMEGGAQIRVLLWLGLEQDQSKWTMHTPGGEVAVFAETVSPSWVCFSFLQKGS